MTLTLGEEPAWRELSDGVIASSAPNSIANRQTCKSCTELDLSGCTDLRRRGVIRSVTSRFENCVSRSYESAGGNQDGSQDLRLLHSFSLPGRAPSRWMVSPPSVAFAMSRTIKPCMEVRVPVARYRSR